MVRSTLKKIMMGLTVWLFRKISPDQVVLEQRPEGKEGVRGADASEQRKCPWKEGNEGGSAPVDLWMWSEATL